MSLTIIDLAKPKASRYIRKEHPQDSEFRTTLERERYFGGEMEKWHLGDKKSGLCGYHYFLIQEGWGTDIKARKKHRLIWREIDDMLIPRIRSNMNNVIDMMVLKPRGVGLNTTIFDCMPVYESIINQNSQIPMTSADDDRIQQMQNNIEFFVNNLNHNFGIYYDYNEKKKFASIYDIEYKGYLDNQSKRTNRDNSIKKSGSFSQIYLRPTTKKANAFDGLRSHIAFIDEIFLNQNIKKVLMTLPDVLGSGAEKMGVFIAGGSSNALDVKAVENIKYILKHKDEKTDIIFIPAGSGSNMFIENGWDNPKKAEEFFLKERERLFKAGDMDKYYNYIRSQPLEITDCFNTIQKGVLSNETVIKLNEQSNSINLNTDILKMPTRGSLVDKDNIVIFEPNNTGKWLVLDSPTIDCPKDINVIGVDPVSLEHDNNSTYKNTRSDYAICVGNRVTNMPIALYSEQVAYSEIGVDELRKAIVWSNARALIESGNSGSTTFSGLRSYSLDNRIMRVPNFLGGNGSQGIAPTVKNESDGRNYMEMFIAKNYDNIWFTDIINNLLAKYHIGENADISFAFKWMCYGMHILDEIDKRKAREQKPTNNHSINFLKNSRIVEVNGVFVRKNNSEIDIKDLFF